MLIFRYYFCMLKIFNTLTKQIEEFIPLNRQSVGLYCCGPTVYGYTHIGHLRKYVGDDILKKVLKMNGYVVKHVMNITDVGHLSSDADSGEDKIDKKAKDEGKSVWEIAKSFENYFFYSLDLVNIQKPDIISRATDHIDEQIQLIKKLESKGFTYMTNEAIYFDTSKNPYYGVLQKQSNQDKLIGSRSEVVVDNNKKNPQDFVLWFFTTGKFQNHIMRWQSPWGIGFPGWHIECSAMSMKYLGQHFDIHTGGIDHIPVHHTNEIAQSESASGEKFVNYWVHHNFLLVEGEKMSKSKNNFYTIDDIVEKGFDPISLRYLFLGAKYRERLDFTWKNLKSAENVLKSLRLQVFEMGTPSKHILPDYMEKFKEAFDEDINTSIALSVVYELLKSNNKNSEKLATLLWMDTILGLNLADYLKDKVKIPLNIKKLLIQINEARQQKDFKKSDKLRRDIEAKGYIVMDKLEGTIALPK